MAVVTRLSNLLLPKAERIEVKRFNSLLEMARSRRNQNDDTTKAVFLEIVSLYGKLNPRNQLEFDNKYLSRELGDERWIISKLLEFKADLVKLGAATVPIFKSAIKNKYSEKKLTLNSAFPLATFEEKVYVPFLAELGSPALPALIEGLKDKDSDLKRISAKALGLIKDRAALDPLAMIIENPSEFGERVKESAIRAIGEIGKPTAPRALEALKATLFHGAFSSQIEESAQAIGKIADSYDSSSIEALRQVLVRKNFDRYAWAQRRASASALREIGGPLAIQALGSALENEDETAREAALGNLAGIKNPLANQFIQAALFSKYRDTAAMARQILSR